MFYLKKQSNLNIATYILIILWGMSTWIDINAIFVQLPLIVIHAPEGWALPSTLSLAIQIANIGPLILAIIQKKQLFGWTTTEPGTKPPCIVSLVIYTIIIINSYGSYVLSATWKINDNKRSYPLIIITFFFALAATSSSLTFFDYVKRYTSEFSLNALLFGESLSSIIPPLLVLIQTNAYIPSCSETNATIYQSQNYVIFSTSVFFIIIGSILLLSLVAFAMLDLGFVTLAKNSIELRTIENETVDFDPKIQKDVKRLLSISVVVNLFNFGILPAISSYSTLPYGAEAYLISSVATPFANSASVVVGLFKSNTKSYKNIIVIVTAGVLGTCYIITAAAMSPCSPMYRTSIGSVIIILIWFIVTFVFCYARLLIVNQIRIIDPSKMFWFGASVQLGGFLGAMPMYLIINQFKLLKSYESCQPITC